MKNTLQNFTLVVFTFLIFGCASAPKSIELPKYTEKKLKNGLKVLIFKDKKLPLAAIQVSVDVGAANDPIAKSGLTSLTTQLLEKGTKSKSAIEVADAFARLGTAFSISSGYDFSVLSASGLSEKQSELFALFTEVLLEPAFSAEEVQRLKNEQIADVKRGYDQPSYVSELVFLQSLYSTHPYGRSDDGTVRDLQSIKQKDIIRHYLKYFRPNNTTIAFVGDVDGAEIKKVLEKMEKWENRAIEKDVLAKPKDISGLNVLLVDRADLQQSEVRIGHLGVERNHPDFLALSVIDTILSGGFNSRLMREIRVRRGLTYGIRSNFDGRREAGPFVIAASTRHEKVGELVSETIKQVAQMYESGITKEELEEAVGYLKGSFPRRFETINQMAGQILGLRLYGIDEQYLRDYLKNLSDLDVASVNKIIRKHLDPKNLNVMVYAPKEKAIGQLRPIGAVTVKNFREFL